MDNRSVKVMNSLTELSSSPSIPSNRSIPNRSLSAVQTQSSSHSSSNMSSHSSTYSPTYPSQASHSSHPSHSSHASRHTSQVVYTPRLKKVLKSYQASATTSLNGPDWVSMRVSSVSSSPSSSSSSVSSPLSSLPLISTPPISLSDPSSRSSISTSIRFGEQSSHSSQSSQSSHNRSKTNSNPNSNGSKCEAYDPFLVPPPFPIQQPPIFTPPDQNRCERSETILEGETISCFTVGGEKRLCLPQILTTVLREFSLPQINSVCDELQIFCSRCTNDQLEVLKLTAIIPASAPSCGLITKTDAERLCAALLYSNPPKSAFSSNANGVDEKRLFTFKVYHECFGKCIGLYVPSLYVQPFSTCIECLECHGLFAPQKFVCHSHRSKENRTCHWGFDSSNWRAYLLLAKDHHKQQEAQDHTLDNDIKEHLKEMKSRFDFKRKIPVTSRDENQVCDPIKRLKTSSPSGLYSYPSYLFSPYGWATDPSLLMYWYPTLASGASGNSAATLAARLSAFKPWSPSSIGNGKHLSQNISQVMPMGYNSSLQTHKLSCEPPLLESPEKITSKRLDRYIEPSAGSAPQTSHNITTSIAQKVLQSTDKLKSGRDKVIYDDDSYSSNNTFSSENSNLSDEENGSAKHKSGKVFSNLEAILDEHKLSQELKLRIISEVQNIINKLGAIETPNIPHKKKILNGIQTKRTNENYKTSSISDRQSDELAKQCLGPMASSPLTLVPVVSCSPTLIKREPNSSPLMADPKINCVH